jgi:hypothetical protein
MAGKCVLLAALGEVAHRKRQGLSPMVALLPLQASRQRLLQETQLLLQQQQQQQHRHSSVLLIDDINHYRSMRYEFVQLARTRKLRDERLCSCNSVQGSTSCTLTTLFLYVQMALRSCSSTWTALRCVLQLVQRLQTTPGGAKDPALQGNARPTCKRRLLHDVLIIDYHSRMLKHISCAAFLAVSCCTNIICAITAACV